MSASPTFTARRPLVQLNNPSNLIALTEGDRIEVAPAAGAPARTVTVLENNEEFLVYGDLSDGHDQVTGFAVGRAAVGFDKGRAVIATRDTSRENYLPGSPLYRRAMKLIGGTA